VENDISFHFQGLTYRGKTYVKISDVLPVLRMLKEDTEDKRTAHDIGLFINSLIDLAL